MFQSDSIAALEKDYGYKDDHFTYIQQFLRRICINCNLLSFHHPLSFLIAHQFSQYKTCFQQMEQL